MSSNGSSIPEALLNKKAVVCLSAAAMLCGIYYYAQLKEKRDRKRRAREQLRMAIRENKQQRCNLQPIEFEELLEQQRKRIFGEVQAAYVTSNDEIVCDLSPDELVPSEAGAGEDASSQALLKEVAEAGGSTLQGVRKDSPRTETLKKVLTKMRKVEKGMEGELLSDELSSGQSEGTLEEDGNPLKAEDSTGKVRVRQSRADGSSKLSKNGKKAGGGVNERNQELFFDLFTVYAKTFLKEDSEGGRTSAA